MAETGESFLEAKSQTIESSCVGRGTGHADVQGEHNAATTSLSSSQASTTQITNKITEAMKTTAAAMQQTQQAQTEPLVQLAAVTGRSDMEEESVNPSPSRICRCEDLKASIGKFIMFAMELILQAVPDRAAAENLNHIMKTNAEEILGFTSTEKVGIK